MVGVSQAGEPDMPVPRAGGVPQAMFMIEAELPERDAADMTAVLYEAVHNFPLSSRQKVVGKIGGVRCRMQRERERDFG